MNDDARNLNCALGLMASVALINMGVVCLLLGILLQHSISQMAIINWAFDGHIFMLVTGAILIPAGIATVFWVRNS